MTELSVASSQQPGHNLNPCDFWLWSYLKDVVHWVPIVNLAELKNRITQHIHNITNETLRSVVLHAALRLQLIGGNGGMHIEHFLRKSKPTSFLGGFVIFSLFLQFLAKEQLKNDFIFAFSTVFVLGTFKN
ncbi:hypothetical protein AVEN_271259-1 [Araneus ventricosus]|uniref:Uncharacterized protein n=1 Tax=Araneus ventricosus TaxID=182803 RepID=A0A4Y2G3H4_ARAVE|nr:hypothetical protein AVEN_271259-1 [Araneus ventricosus]